MPKKIVLVNYPPMHLLFICSRNKKRSRTAEAIFRHHAEHTISSAGTEENARIKVTEKMISRADLIFVMERVHRDKLQHKFGSLLHGKEIITLNIPDEYEYMDEDLVLMLQDMMAGYL